MLATRHAFSEDVVECRVAPGMTLRQIVGDCGDGLAVTLDGTPVPADRWASTTPAPGSEVTVVPLPHGGDSRTLLLTIGLIAAAAFGGPAIAGALKGAGAAGFFGGGSTAVSFWSGAIYAVGSLLIASLVKPPVVEPESEPRRLAGVSGVRNDFRPFGAVPVIYGRHKVFPPYAALPWTEVIGDDQYFNALFALGIGDHEVTDAKIGETLLTNYQGVELTQTKTPVWPNIIEDSLSTDLGDPSDPGSAASTATFTTASNIEAISVDFVAPIGLRYTTDKAERFKGQLDFRVEFRPSGSAAPWTNVLSVLVGGFDWVDFSVGGNVVLGVPGLPPLSYVGPVSVSPLDPTCFRVQGNTSDTIRFGLKWNTGGSGRWDVRVTRVHFYTDRFGSTPITANDEFDKSQQKMVWTALRSHDVDTAAVDTTKGVDFLQLRIKASDTVQGQLDQFSVIAHRVLRGWDKSAQDFTTPVATRSPAWAYLDMLTGLANARPVTDPVAKIWLDELADWAAACATADRKFDRVFDQELTVFDVLGICASAGRAGRSLRDARHTVITEEQSPVPTQLFTPRNSSGFSFEHRFVDMPHALKVRFLSEDQDWQQDEITVYDDGYDVSNATKFETVTFDGKTDPDEAWKFGRYHLAQARLRPALYTLTVDVEHLASVRGDLVHVEHDVLLWNLGRGRIVRAVGRYITLDESFPIEFGVSYKLKVRSVTPAGAVQVNEYDVTAPVGTSVNTFLASTNLSANTQEGDLCILGKAGLEDVALKILTVQPRTGLRAELTLVDAAPEILTADTGPIPPYDPNITHPVQPEDVVPPAPIIVAVNSVSQLGVVAPNGQRMARMEISYRVPSFQGTLYDQVEARVRKVQTTEEQPWVILPRQGIRSGGIAVFLVEPGETYEVQMRVVTVFGTPSPWSNTVTHTVEDIVIGVPAAGGIAVGATSEGIAISLDVGTLEHRSITRVHVRLGTVNDRDHASTESYFFPVPRNFAALDTVDVFLPLTGLAQDFYVWARFEDEYENIGDWVPLNALAGAFVHYPGTPVSGVLFSASAGLAFVQAGDGTWNATQTDLTFRWFRAGAQIAERVVRITRTGSNLDDSLVSATGEATTHQTTGDGTSSMTVLASHVNSGEYVPATVTAVSSGGTGPAGPAGEGSWTPVISAGMQVSGKSIEKIANDGDWNEQVTSLEKYGSCGVWFQPAQANKNFIIGLDQNPIPSSSYDTIDRGIFCFFNGTFQPIENGTLQVGGTYVAGDQFSIQYDGQHVRYIKNGVVFRTIGDASRVFHLDSSFFDVGARADNVVFAPIPGAKVDLATQIAGTLTAAFAEAGLINANVTINADGTLTAAGGGQVQINQLPGSVTTGQLAANVVTAVQANILNLAALKADLGAITAGNITFNSSGAFIKLGTAGFESGVGFYVEYNGGTPRVFFGDFSNGKFVSWDGTTLEISGQVTLLNAVQTFTPTWSSGFSSDPSGDISYIDFGAFVVMFRSSALTGTANANTMVLTGVPAAIRPSGQRWVPCSLVDGSGNAKSGLAILEFAAGQIDFAVGIVTSSKLNYSTTDFVTSGTKGLTDGWMIIYSK